MAKNPTAMDQARQRMLEADNAKNAGLSDADWSVWQQAAADYWVARHPEVARFRRGDPDRTLTIEEIRERGQQLAHAMDGVPDTWRLSPPTPERTEHLAKVGWFHELQAGIYEPVYRAVEQLRRGDPTGLELAVRFLEADVYCFHSGYAKVDVIRAVVGVELNDRASERLREVVLRVVDASDRREFRAYGRLARKVDSDDLREELRHRDESGARYSARHARLILARLAEPPHPKRPDGPS